VEKLKGNIIRW